MQNTEQFRKDWRKKKTTCDWGKCDKKLYHRFEDAHLLGLNHISITSDSKFAASASDDFSIKIFDRESKTEIHHFNDVHKASVWAVKISSDSKYMASGSKDKSVKVFDFLNRK